MEKIHKTKTGNMLITLSKKSIDKCQALQKAITDVLQKEAEVICKGPQEMIEIRDPPEGRAATNPSPREEMLYGDTMGDQRIKEKGV
ncbi:Protein of unknown function [Cotesia congregata]|uniref:Uncharacterized protein n=1 Tax=Cotesia congregata TaxID=51543 RepID=A0A8J2HG75_COTCN|nr:Protein of unknown function [Cotesia congregata]